MDSIWEPHLKPGDAAWCFTFNEGPAVIQRTVGLVRVIVTDSPGIPQEGVIFDNYAPQQGRTEEYMCVETGIGTGTLYEWGRNIFATEADALAAWEARKVESAS